MLMPLKIGAVRSPALPVPWRLSPPEYVTNQGCPRESILEQIPDQAPSRYSGFSTLPQGLFDPVTDLGRERGAGQRRLGLHSVHEAADRVAE